MSGHNSSSLPLPALILFVSLLLILHMCFVNSITVVSNLRTSRQSHASTPSPESTIPDSTLSYGKSPESNTPDSTVSYALSPESTIPDSTVNSGKSSESNTPGSTENDRKSHVEVTTHTLDCESTESDRDPTVTHPDRNWINASLRDKTVLNTGEEEKVPSKISYTGPCPESHPALTSPCERQTGLCINLNEQAGRKMPSSSPKPMKTSNSTYCTKNISILLTKVSQLLNHVEDCIWGSNASECYREWRIVAPGFYNYIVEFHHVEMAGADFLEIRTSDGNISYLWRNFTRVPKESLSHVQPQMSLAPLLVHGTEMVIRLNVFKKKDFLPPSAFNMSYIATNESLPLPVQDSHKNLTQSDARTTYDCSGFEYLPKVMTCDGVNHCKDGEDEMYCPFCEQGCDDWVPYNNHCLKVFFVIPLTYKPGQSHVTMPLQAEHFCRSLNATLALLPDRVGITIVADIIRKSGFQNAVVGIKKMKPTSRKLRHLYRYIWQWGDLGHPVAYEQQELQRSGTTSDCAIMKVAPVPHVKAINCVLPSPPPHGYVCMRPNPTHHVKKFQLSGIKLLKASEIPDQFPTKECADGSVVQLFHHCQWGRYGKDQKINWSPSNFPVFKCSSGDTVHYSLLCDGKDDCADGTDEEVCKSPQNPVLRQSSFICRNGQTVSSDKRCNGMLDCFDESDEESCLSCGSQIMCHGVGCVPRVYSKYFNTCPELPVFGEAPFNSYTPARVELDGYGMSRLEPVTKDCGEGYYSCREGFCIPAYLLNNGEEDCLHGEDEGIPVQNITCPGFYRCQETGSCVHRAFVCDGIYHCPNKDDEMFCHLTCPTDEGCRCEGQAYTCSRMIDPRQYPHVRYLDLSYASGVSLKDIGLAEYLFFLNLSFCQLSSVTLMDMPHLQILDLSFNSLTELSNVTLHGLHELKYLDLSNNPFIMVCTALSLMLKSSGFHNLVTLVLTNVSLKSIEDEMFSPLIKLELLDIRNNPIHSYGKDSLRGLTALETLYTDESKLCCSYFHSSLPHCYAPVDELSSCSDLLAQDFFRVCLWTMSVLAITGNAGVIIYRQFINKHASNRSFRILVLNLCTADLLMGLYMMMIGAADAWFRGMYVAKERVWTGSFACKLAGFLCFVSSEVSAFTICLITLDRVLVICFPFKLRVHLGHRTILYACCTIWVIGVALAAVPVVAGMEFYGLNSICVPLPITRRRFSGQVYAFSIFIILNFVLFVFIGAGQVLIYRAVYQASTALASQRRVQDVTVARRLFLVVFTDFCCWFPIGLMGLLVSRGIPVSGQLNVWAAIFVLPLNSALNPFLYTLNLVKNRRKRRQTHEREVTSMVQINCSRQASIPCNAQQDTR